MYVHFYVIELATTGEKEWYFYCPRDRKYRNSARPNRVTGAGFWKATGTDRPIYSSEGNTSKCIGLKKSLVFYKGKAAKGIKTDWMMHEFRLPSLTDSLHNNKRFSSSPSLDKTIPANVIHLSISIFISIYLNMYLYDLFVLVQDAWAICRIFKKTNSTAQRALSQSWVSSLPETTITDNNNTTHLFASDNIPFHYNCDQQPTTTTHLFPLDFVSYNKTINQMPTNSAPIDQISTGFMFSPLEIGKSNVDVSSLLLNMSSSSSMLGFNESQQQLQQQQHVNGLSTLLSHDQVMIPDVIDQMGYQFGLPPMMNIGDQNHTGGYWKPSSSWDTSSSCPSEMSTSVITTTNKCYT